VTGEYTPASTLYTGGEIVTLDGRSPGATALATFGDRILAVGDARSCRGALRAAGARDFAHVELAGRTVLPGFIDTHLHPIAMLYFDLNADLRAATSVASVQEALRLRGARLAPGDWVVGLSLEDADLAERRLPTRRELDAACPDRPAIVLKHDGHSASGNSRALAAAGIDAATPDPSGGRIEREPDGTPAGPCRESASQLLLGAVPSPSLERLRGQARATFGRLAASGVTSAGVILQTDEEGPGGASGRMESLALLLLADELPFEPYSILIGKTVDAAIAAQRTALHDPLRGRRVGGFKIFADGTLGSCTACVREAFADRPGERGYMTLADDAIFARMRAAHAAELQICVHAIGDAAIDRCIGLFERLLAEAPRRDHRHRIEHASIVPPDLIPRMAALGLCVSAQPLFIHSEKGWLHRRVGAERARHVYPLRSLVDGGVIVAGASDAPVESVDVLHAIQCCVTREGFEPQEALTPAEALALFTTNAAWLQFEEDEKGTLAPGNRADLVVLSGNPLAVAPDRIASLRVLRTVAGGRITYDSEGASR
jgi:predicted amidohydrolase YtcJ